MDLEELDESDLQSLANIYQGLSYWVRLVILVGLSNDRSLNTISDHVDITRGAMQDHIETLLDADLIYRPDEQGTTYALTPLGDFYLNRLESDLEIVLPAVERLTAARKGVTDEHAEELEVLSNSDLTDVSELEDQLDTKTWETVSEDVRSLLFDDA